MDFFLKLKVLPVCDIGNGLTATESVQSLRSIPSLSRSIPSLSEAVFFFAGDSGTVVSGFYITKMLRSARLSPAIGTGRMAISSQRLKMAIFIFSCNDDPMLAQSLMTLGM